MADYRPIARQAARKYGIPENIFMALINQESGWDPKIGSPAGAVGLVQIHLPSHPDVSYQQATNPRFALDWGARYLASQYKRFGNWRQALAAYNAGPSRAADGSWKNIGETRNYVRSILGAAGNVTMPGPSSAAVTGPGPDPTVSAPSMPALPDLSQQVLESLGTVGHHDYDANAQLANLAMSVAGQRTAAAGAQPGASPAAPTPRAHPAAPNVAPDYSSLTLGKVIGTPGVGTHTIGNWQSDNAWDIRIPVGTPIRADADGVIGSRIGFLGSPKDKGRFAGQRINLQGQKNAYYYAHLSKITVKPGEHVHKGQIIGYSGEANGVPHLHFGVQHI
jgi:murein DD-endopeptidase MepM/ murein hydrolase activator NlpD